MLDIFLGSSAFSGSFSFAFPFSTSISFRKALLSLCTIFHWFVLLSLQFHLMRHKIFPTRRFNRFPPIFRCNVATCNVRLCDCEMLTTPCHQHLPCFSLAPGNVSQAFPNFHRLEVLFLCYCWLRTWVVRLALYCAPANLAQTHLGLDTWTCASGPPDRPWLFPRHAMHLAKIPRHPCPFVAAVSCNCWQFLMPSLCMQRYISSNLLSIREFFSSWVWLSAVVKYVYIQHH